MAMFEHLQPTFEYIALEPYEPEPGIGDYIERRIKVQSASECEQAYAKYDDRNAETNNMEEFRALSYSSVLLAVLHEARNHGTRIKAHGVSDGWVITYQPLHSGERVVGWIVDGRDPITGDDTYTLGRIHVGG